MPPADRLDMPRLLEARVLLPLPTPLNALEDDEPRDDDDERVSRVCPPTLPELCRF
jgi:hypothetical protein